MEGTTLARLKRCLKEHKSFRIGRRDADWFFYTTCEIFHPEDEGEESLIDAKMEAIKATAWGQEANE